MVKGCGPENEALAELILYLLTDNKGTRPIKSREIIEQELQDFKGLSPEVAFTDSQLTLVLDILSVSGLVIRLQEIPPNPPSKGGNMKEYQLWHDYFVRFIRDKQEPKIQAILAALETEREKGRSLEKSLQQVQIEIDDARTTKTNLEQQNRNATRLVKISGGVAISLLLVAGGTALWTNQKITEANNKIADANVKVQDADKKVIDADTQRKNAQDEVIKTNNKVKEATTNALKATKQTQEAVKKAKEADNAHKLEQLLIANAIRKHNKQIEKLYNKQIEKLKDKQIEKLRDQLQKLEQE